MKVDSKELKNRLAHFESICREKGVKITHQRRVIFKEVASSREHPDAESIYNKVKISIPEISLDTVYRTLRLFNEIGIVSTLGLQQERARFDANLKNHHHYYCLRCKLARDFESSELNNLDIPDEIKEFGSIASSHVEVRGICVKCARELRELSISNKNYTPKGKEREKNDREKETDYGKRRSSR